MMKSDVRENGIVAGRVRLGVFLGFNLFLSKPLSGCRLNYI